MAFEVETVTEIEALLGTGIDDDWDFEAIEMAARRMAMRVAARAVEQRLNDDTSDHAGPTLPCACGQSARYADRHGKNFESVLGSLRLERAYYYCELCEEGFCPRDRALGLEGGSLSPGVRRMVGLVGAMVSFEEGHELLHELAGVNVPTKHVERAAEALGREIAVDEKLVVEPPRANEPLAPTLYLGMDGTGVPVRKEELVDRPGKQPDGSAKTREVKLVTIWSAEGRDKKGTPVRDLGSISYSAAIESAAHKDTDLTPSAFAARVEREATRRGFDRAARQTALGDGARWIWNLTDEHFPYAVQLTVSTPSSTSRMWPSPSTARAATSHSSGHANATTSWTLAISTPFSTPYDYTRRRMTRRASASTTSNATASACATRSSGQQGFVPRLGSLRPAARWRSEPDASAPACTGPSLALTRSSPCAAASSAVVSKSSGSAVLNGGWRDDRFSSHNPDVHPSYRPGAGALTLPPTLKVAPGRRGR